MPIRNILIQANEHLQKWSGKKTFFYGLSMYKLPPIMYNIKINLFVGFWRPAKQNRHVGNSMVHAGSD
ncbi:hypothetical protein D3Z39_01715 [Anaerotruncus colihominis]|uniref:Uncharacterized protein n=1 Tax=Anaerotruncus colihominis TaxID=169435 RepID=A0A845RIL8_9FIRM|nr:hypothetical protein [Anaerotruncus colihominis]